MDDDDGRLYRSRDLDEAATARFIGGLIQDLVEREVRTRPGDDTVTTGKHVAARMALTLAGTLVDAVAGWAIDHQIGLAALGLRNLPPAPNMDLLASKPLKALTTEAKKEASALDRNAIEMEGGDIFQNGKALDPTAMRQALKSILEPMGGMFPQDLHRQIIDGLEALEYGEHPAIFAPVKDRRRLQLQETRLQLKALAHIEFRVRKRGTNKSKIQKEVADAFSRSVEALSSWETRLRKADDVGEAMVARELAFAANAASNEEDGLYVATEYSDDQLAQDGRLFKKLGEVLH